MDKLAIKNSLRNKKIGILLLDARQSLRLTAEECARAVGLPVSEYLKIEKGERPASLPELEVLAFYMKIPLDHFWTQDLLGQTQQIDPIQEKSRFMYLRNRVISTNIRLLRTQKNLSLKELSEKSGISEETLKVYEMGDSAIPISDLETLAESLEISIDKFFDQHSLVGKWRYELISVQKFRELPPELQEFVLKPVNQPYVHLAVRLSSLSVEKLRSVAESLLEITY